MESKQKKEFNLKKPFQEDEVAKKSSIFKKILTILIGLVVVLGLILGIIYLILFGTSINSKYFFFLSLLNLSNYFFI